MSRFRLLPTPEQEEALLAHCRDARYVWNLAVEQQQHWQPERKAPGYLEQCAQLTEARAARGTIEQPGVGVAQKRGLNRAIGRSGWGLLVARLQHKTFGRVEQIPAARTSQRCSACGHVAPGNRKSQAVFQCEACTAGRCNADVNAVRNIAAGRTVTARGDLAGGRSVNREPQLATPAA
jgi:transposase